MVQVERHRVSRRCNTTMALSHHRRPSVGACRRRRRPWPWHCIMNGCIRRAAAAQSERVCVIVCSNFRAAAAAQQASDDDDDDAGLRLLKHLVVQQRNGGSSSGRFLPCRLAGCGRRHSAFLCAFSLAAAAVRRSDWRVFVLLRRRRAVAQSPRRERYAALPPPPPSCVMLCGRSLWRPVALRGRRVAAVCVGNTILAPNASETALAVTRRRRGGCRDCGGGLRVAATPSAALANLWRCREWPASCAQRWRHTVAAAAAATLLRAAAAPDSAARRHSRSGVPRSVAVALQSARRRLRRPKRCESWRAAAASVAAAAVAAAASLLVLESCCASVASSSSRAANASRGGRSVAACEGFGYIELAARSVSQRAGVGSARERIRVLL